MYRFLLSPKWIASFLLCVLAALVCVRLAHWQLDRLDQKRAINASITTARNASPTPADQALSTKSKPDKRHNYSKVQAVGQYDVAHEVLVRNRTQDVTLGYYILTPLRTTDGPVLWVVRGWVAASNQGATVIPAYDPAPGGTVTVVGRVRELESGSTGSVQVSGHNLITRITSHAIKGTGEPAYDAYVELISQDPASGDTSLVTLPAPDDLDEGPHLAYAIQWYIFAIGFLVGYGYFARTYAHRDDVPPAVEGSPNEPVGVESSSPT